MLGRTTLPELYMHTESRMIHNFQKMSSPTLSQRFKEDGKKGRYCGEVNILEACLLEALMALVAILRRRLHHQPSKSSLPLRQLN